MDETQQSRLSRAFWVRHANPWSGSSRTVTLPVLVYAVFTRRWRLLAAGIAFSIVDPVLVSPPRDSDA